jgi:hypothetical protein
MRVSDVRATQFWDLWDLTAIYPKNSSLQSKPVFVAGPLIKRRIVFRIADHPSE